MLIKNVTCKEVSTSIRQLLGKTTEYEIGEKLICREYFKSLKTTYDVNYEYEIVDTCDKYLTKKEVHSNEETTVPLSTIRSKFIFNYCATCHSLQGSSISGPVTIFDWNHYFVDKKWVWTAITRATNLDDLYFYDYDDEDIKIESELKQYFTKKSTDIKHKINKLPAKYHLITSMLSGVCPISKINVVIAIVTFIMKMPRATLQHKD